MLLPDVRVQAAGCVKTIASRPSRHSACVYRGRMTTADRYRRLATIFDATIASVGDWDAPSPCVGWTARDVLEHVASTEADSVTKVGLSIDRTIDTVTDPLGSWREVRDAMQAVLDDPAKAEREYMSLGSQTTLAAAIDRYFCFDLIVHRWDIATAAGLAIVIPPGDIADANAFLDSVGQMFYDYGASAPPIEVADDASAQDTLLGRAGRDVRKY